MLHIQKTKRGFTLVELLVVIAILAILMTVSVVGYTSFIERANMSKDTALISQYNTILDACAVHEGHNQTMAQVFADLLANGIEDVSLKANAKHCDIVWDSTADRFLLVKDGAVLYPELSERITLSNCFTAVYEGDEMTGPYSVYLAEELSQQAILLHNVGFDDGGRAASFSLSGDTAEEIVVNTVGGSATVNLPKGTVHHYGNAEQVTIEAIGNASYHVYGQIKQLTLHSGHVVLEKGAAVEQLIVHGGTVLCKKGASAATFEEDAEHIENQGGSVTVLPMLPPPLFAGGDGSKENPYLISTPQQFANIASLMENNYYQEEETVIVTSLVEKRIYATDLNLKDGFCKISSVTNGPCKEEGVHDFSELPETEQSNVYQVFEDRDQSLDALDDFGLKYEIKDYGKVDCIIYYEPETTEETQTVTRGNEYYYFRLTADISLPEDYTPISMFYGELDGAGYTLSTPVQSADQEQECVIFTEALAESAFRNLRFCSSPSDSLVGGENGQDNEDLIFENITKINREDMPT